MRWLAEPRMTMRMLVTIMAAWGGLGMVEAGGIHDGYDALLRRHVRDGGVDYAGMKKDEVKLDGYLDLLARTNPGALGREGQLAFWINAYNAFTLKLILRKYPGIVSIKDIPSRWDTVEWKAGGRLYSLEDIEHRLLRKMGEPRIHFAIVCASKSCPDLLPEAYQPEKLDAQLTAATRRFLANDWKGMMAREEKGFFGGGKAVLRLSKIFSWFGKDFEKSDGGVVGFVLPYAPPLVQEFVRAHRQELSLDFFSYDWSLNGQ